MVKPSIRVLCVDDHLIVREGIAFIIDSQPDMKVIATAATGEQAVSLFRQHHPDVTVMDLRLPGMSGFDAIAEICREWPDARIVALTAYHGDEDAYSALHAGAVSYVFKDSVSYELIQVLRAVHAGQRPLPPDVQALLAGHDERAALSAREHAVVTLMAQGMRNKEIASTLGISALTVQSHTKRIFVKLRGERPHRGRHGCASAWDHSLELIVANLSEPASHQDRVAPQPGRVVWWCSNHVLIVGGGRPGARSAAML